MDIKSRSIMNITFWDTTNFSNCGYYHWIYSRPELNTKILTDMHRTTQHQTLAWDNSANQK